MLFYYYNNEWMNAPLCTGAAYPLQLLKWLFRCNINLSLLVRAYRHVHAGLWCEMDMHIISNSVYSVDMMVLS